MINILYKNWLDVNEQIKIKIPIVGEVLDHEEEYYGLVTTLTAMPIDFMVQLDDRGIDFSEVTEYELFLGMFDSVRSQDTSLIFGDLDLSNFVPYEDEEAQEIVLFDDKNNIIIDRRVQQRIALILRTIHHLKKNNKKPGNEEAKRYMIERARTRLKRNKGRNFESQLEPLIVAMVNTEQYKYDYESTKNLTIYQFNKSVRQIIGKVEYDHKMGGIYAGTVDVKKIDKKELDWINYSNQ